VKVDHDKGSRISWKISAKTWGFGVIIKGARACKGNKKSGTRISLPNEHNGAQSIWKTTDMNVSSNKGKREENIGGGYGCDWKGVRRWQHCV